MAAPQMPPTALDSASSLSTKLMLLQASSLFTKTGELTDETIARSGLIQRGTQMGNSHLQQYFAEHGGAEQWGKYGEAALLRAVAMDAMELELSLYDWAALPCRRCKSAEHVAGDLLRLARAQTREEAEPRGIEGHVFQETWGTKTVVSVARAMMAGLAGLAGHSLSVQARHQFLDLVWGFVVLDDDHLAEACKDVVRTGIWTLYEEVFSGRAKGSALVAYWLVKEVETAPGRVEPLLQVARHLLPEDLHEDED